MLLVCVFWMRFWFDVRHPDCHFVPCDLSGGSVRLQKLSQNDLDIGSVIWCVNCHTIAPFRRSTSRPLCVCWVPEASLYFAHRILEPPSSSFSIQSRLLVVHAVLVQTTRIASQFNTPIMSNKCLYYLHLGPECAYTPTLCTCSLLVPKVSCFFLGMSLKYVLASCMMYRVISTTTVMLISTMDRKALEYCVGVLLCVSVLYQ